jgi:hypothetical protein
MKYKNNVRLQTNMEQWIFVVKFSKKCPEKNRRKIRSF